MQVSGSASAEASDKGLSAETESCLKLVLLSKMHIRFHPHLHPRFSFALISTKLVLTGQINVKGTKLAPHPVRLNGPFFSDHQK